MTFFLSDHDFFRFLKIIFPIFFAIFPRFSNFLLICLWHKKNINFHNKNCDKTNSTFRRSWRYEKQENRVKRRSGSTEIFSMFMILTRHSRRGPRTRQKREYAMIDDSIKRANNSIPRLKTLTLLPLFFQEVVFKNNSEKFFVLFSPLGNPNGNGLHGQ